MAASTRSDTKLITDSSISTKTKFDNKNLQRFFTLQSMIREGGIMKVRELIAKLSEFDLEMEVLVKSFESDKVKLTLFEKINEVKKEGLCKGDDAGGFFIL